MNLLAEVAAALAVLAAVITSVSAATLWHGRRRALSTKDLSEAYDPYVLGDSRSCQQESLELFEAALPEAEQRNPIQRNAAQVIQLLEATPLLALSEVIDDHALLAIERSTEVRAVWIVIMDESIEFEYPTATVTFTEAVLDNLARGVVYRYLVKETAATRTRAQKIVEMVRADGFDDRFQIRFLPSSYWEKLHGTVDGLVAYGGSDAAKLFYRFPDPRPSGVRKWVEAPADDARARICDLRAAWGTAERAVGPAGELDPTGVATVSPRRTGGD